ncbi:MAG: tetratricopeptide repeat protein [Anaerolineae bacterium]
MDRFEKYKEDFILLAEAGFIAVNQADEDAAVKLFRASELLNPQNFLPKVGMGYMHLCKLELKQACKVFDEVLSHDPTNEMAKAFLGLCLTFTPTEVAKGEQLLEESAKKSHDPLIKNLAVSALDFVDKFVKKNPTPVHPPKDSKKNSK